MDSKQEVDRRKSWLIT